MTLNPFMKMIKKSNMKENNVGAVSKPRLKIVAVRFIAQRIKCISDFQIAIN